MIGFLHTADVHTATFTELLEQVASGTASNHVVDATLLTDARRRGRLDDELRAQLSERLVEASLGAGVVVCTCSTISGHAEQLAGVIGVPVVRIDRPMAEQAVALGGRIAVVAALASTIGPTTELLRQVAGGRRQPVELFELVVDGAWARFEQDDLDGYAETVARAIDEVAAVEGGVDVIVLAQASMAAASTRCTTSVPVLSSPRPAVEAAVRALDPSAI